MPNEYEYYRIIQEKSDLKSGMHYVACPACLQDTPLSLFTARDHYNDLPGEFHVVKCRKCGLIYTNPRPFGKNLTSYYPDDAGYYQPDTDFEELKKGSIKKSKHSLLCKYLGYGIRASERTLPPLSRVPGRLLRKGLPRFVPDGRLLEIGCSYGKFLYQLACLGWNVDGVELNQTAAEVARTKLNLNVTSAHIEDLDLQPNFYDCVIMRMVLEHIASPVDCLMKLNSAMKEGGELILAVPNFDSFEASYFKQYSYFLHVPQHMTHFTPESISVVLEKSGFKIMRKVGIKSKRDVIKSAKIRASECGDDLLAKVVEQKWFSRAVLKIWLNYTYVIGRSSRMMIYARKTVS